MVTPWGPVDTAILGPLFALLAPAAWSTAVILYKRTHAPAAGINLFKNSLAVALLCLTVLATGDFPPPDRSAEDWARLIVSGFLGLSFADMLFFEGLRRVDAAKMAIVDTVYSPAVVLLSWLVLGEHLSSAFAVGAGLVFAGLALATVRPGALRVENTDEWRGLAYGGVAIASTALAVVLAKPVLERSSLIEVTLIRLSVGVAGQLVWTAARNDWKDALACFRPSRTWLTLVPAAFIGAYLSMMLWLGGYKWAPASLAAVLNQMATVYVLVLAALVLKERLRPAQITGALLAAGGAVWIVVFRE